MGDLPSRSCGRASPRIERDAAELAAKRQEMMNAPA